MSRIEHKLAAAGGIAIGRRRKAAFPASAMPSGRSLPSARSAPSARAVLSARPVKALSQREWAMRYRIRLIMTDAAVIIGAVSLSFLFHFGPAEIWPAEIWPPETVSGIAQEQVLAVSAAIVASWLAFLASGRTRDARVLGSGVSEYRRVAHATAFAFGILAIAFLVLQIEVIRGSFVLALPVGTAALLLDRWLWRKWLIRRRRAGEYLARALVVGHRDDVEYVVRQISTQHNSSYTVVGASVVEEANPEAIVAAEGLVVPIVSHVDEVAGSAANLAADAVIIAGPITRGTDYIRRLGWDLEGTATELVLAARLTDVAGPRIHFRPVDGLPLIHVEIPQFEGGHHIMKRALDVSLTALALVSLAPLFGVIAMLVKLDSPGPALFRQERVGRNGERFTMVKFRSMAADAEQQLPKLLAQHDGNRVLFKLKDDPRVTRIGRFLRKYSLDEFPQLWNVLVGDMSLVGPRPPLAREVEGYERDVHRRLHIKPGVTGMWQVSGRSDLSWDEGVRLDLYYVENWSITGDLMILWQTVKVVLRPVGAY